MTKVIPLNTESPSKNLFLPVAIGRAGEEIVLQIEAAIMDGRLLPGERLPSERDMQSLFSVGRGVIREALKMLRQKGLLEVRKGVKGGAYVRRVEVATVSESLALFLKQQPVDPMKLIEFRECIDRDITALAVAHGAPADKEALLEQAMVLERMLHEDAPDLAAVSELDRRLNVMLAGLAQNPVFEWVMRALQMGFSSNDFTLYEDPAYRKEAASNWSDTARAIATGDLTRALSFIGYHYVLLRRRFEERRAETRACDQPLFQETIEDRYEDENA